MQQQLEELVLTLWRKRMEAGAVKTTVGELMKVVKDPAALDAVEFYLPQFAHMIIQLGADIPDISELEKFVLAACQMSIHVALQFFWIVYASLQEHRPKKGGNRGIYARCSRLLLHLEQCVAYGVAVPGVEGRAGMAALLMQPGAPPPDMRELYAGIEAQLPPYAQPRFVRLLSGDGAIETTVTFKPKKGKLQEEGFDVTLASPVFIRDAATRSFVPLTASDHAALARGERALD